VDFFLPFFLIFKLFVLKITYNHIYTLKNKRNTELFVNFPIQARDFLTRWFSLWKYKKLFGIPVK